jgi:hypothetical protein
MRMHRVFVGVGDRGCAGTGMMTLPSIHGGKLCPYACHCVTIAWSRASPTSATSATFRRDTLKTWFGACYNDSTIRVIGSVGVIRSAGADVRR